ncbi:hypothetical protein F5144DRAFT_628062 [Chaetomium tenue]|uniref:Uncharacterized protein n=1 Tax=Chaetomium tenue TaxID=1854479 RepID=A0ACB7PA54_9PEZI|nr:hypothetical protein F5144DRAFT_628062 [Chaetomium globosum]
MEDNLNETAKLGRLYRESLDGVLAKIKALGAGVYVLDDECLASLNIRKAEPLDIEEKSIDFGPRFFCPRFTLEEARQKTSAYLADAYPNSSEYPEWQERCRRGSYRSLLPMTDAQLRLGWCEKVMGGSAPDGSPNQGVWGDSRWCFWASWSFPPDEWGKSALTGHYGPVRVGSPPRFYTFKVTRAFVMRDPSLDMPHIGGSVVDAAESGEGDVLRSEVVAALELLKLQFRQEHFCQHHTLPAIVFSFQHDRFGRFSQFHCHGRSLVLRQSRLLDFRSDEPTTDAYHI